MMKKSVNMISLSKRAAIIYGPPGSGKSTQAELLNRRFEYFYFNTGSYIERVVHNKENKNDPVIRKQRILFDKGVLCEPWWVLKIILEEGEKIGKAGWDVVFSGSPRTVFEAFGDVKNKGLLEILKKYYGKKNIFIFHLKVEDKSCLYRNSNRMLCMFCGLPILALYKKNKMCSFCMGKVYKRTLDKPEVITVRLMEYKKRTHPILARMKKEKYNVFSINGELSPYKIHEQIARKLRL